MEVKLGTHDRNTLRSRSRNRVLLSYVPKSDTKLQVVDKGTGGINELKDQLK